MATDGRRYSSGRLWAILEPVIRARQPHRRLPSANAKGWIGPICSPLREDTNPSFSVRPDIDGPGGWADHAGEGGSLRELVERLGLELPAEQPRQPRTAPAPALPSVAEWCQRRPFRHSPEQLAKVWGVQPVVRQSRPALRYPTELGVDRIKFLDGQKPKYFWAKKGGRAHWYGFGHLHAGPIYIVNGEPAVWAAHALGVAAIGPTAGEGKPPDTPEIKRLLALGRPLRIVFDRDDTGRKGAQRMLAALREASDGTVDVRALELPAELGDKADVEDLAGRVGADLPRALSDLPDLSAPDPRPRIVDLVPGAPVTSRLCPPDADYWEVGIDGIRRLRTIGRGQNARMEWTVVAQAPILLVRRLVDLADASEHLELTWPRDGKWPVHTVPRGTALDRRKVIALADMGAPVTSSSAGAVVEWLSALEFANLDTLPTAWISSRMGWLSEDSYLCGSQYFTRDARQQVRYRANTPGEDELVHALGSSGTWDGWSDAIAVLADYPRAALALYASLAAPLLRLVRAPNFIVSWSGATSTGKTTIMRVAASCWGNPDERRPGSLIHTWDLTRVHLERVAGALTHLPLLIDDTSRARSAADVGQIIYQVASGRGRGRGTLQGIAATVAWHTVLLSTGEAPLASHTSHGGTRARILELWGRPFGRADEDTAILVNLLNAGVRTNYGHAAPRLIEWLLSHRSGWDDIVSTYAASRQRWGERAGGSSIVHRLSDYVAVIETTAAIVHEALDLPWSYEAALDVLWEAVTAESHEADRPLMALELAINWAVARQQDFWGRERRSPLGDPITPSNGWAGTWDKGDSWQRLSILRQHIDGLLSAAGYEPEAILRIWRERGWTIPDGRHSGPKVQIDGSRARCIAITRDAFDVAIGDVNSQQSAPRGAPVGHGVGHPQNRSVTGDLI